MSSELRTAESFLQCSGQVLLNVVINSVHNVSELIILAETVEFAQKSISVIIVLRNLQFIEPRLFSVFRVECDIPYYDVPTLTPGIANSH